jgi:hypothetical protein
MLRRVALVRTDVSEEPSASIIRVIRIGELGTTLAGTSNRRKLRRKSLSTFLRNVGSYKSHTAQQPRRRHSSSVDFADSVLRVPSCRLYSPFISHEQSRVDHIALKRWSRDSVMWLRLCSHIERSLRRCTSPSRPHNTTSCSIVPQTLPLPAIGTWLINLVRSVLYAVIKMLFTSRIWPWEHLWLD